MSRGRAMVRWWVPLLGIGIAWLGACWPVCAGAQSTPAQEVERYVQCYASALGVLGRWEIQYEYLPRDSVPWVATTETNMGNFRATMRYNLAWLAEHTEDIRRTALHETLHVFLGELMGLAYATSPDWALVATEQLVRQITRWPWWVEVCP